MDCYSFPVGLFHPLQHAGLTRRYRGTPTRSFSSSNQDRKTIRRAPAMCAKRLTFRLCSKFRSDRVCRNFNIGAKFRFTGEELWCAIWPRCFAVFCLWPAGTQLKRTPRPPEPRLMWPPPGLPHTNRGTILRTFSGFAPNLIPILQRPRRRYHLVLSGTEIHRRSRNLPSCGPG